MIESKKIREFLSDIKTKNTQETLENFWKDIERLGTPLVEEIPGTSTYLVTFLWRGKEHKNVVVTNYGVVSYDPKDNQMTHIPDTDVWYRSFVMPKGLTTAYNISIDDPLISICDFRFEDVAGATFPFHWELDPFNKSTYTVPSMFSVLGKEQVLSRFSLPGARTPSYESTSSKGTLKKEHFFSSLLDQEREVYIYLPYEYDPHQEEAYPLLVTFDGDAFKDMMHGKEMLDDLIAKEEIPPLIAVMICNPEPNSMTRMRDLSCNAEFTKFLAQELIPWVQETWNATEDPTKTVLAGCSMGGLAACFGALLYPEIFGNVLAQSPCLWWSIHGEKNWVIERYKEKFCQETKFYLQAGVLETAKTFEHGMNFLEACETFESTLLELGYDVVYEPFAGGHDYFCWELDFPEGLRHLFQTETSSFE